MTAALKDAPVLPRDKAAVQLVRRYAQLLDDARGQPNEAEVYVDLGPKLLAALTALGMTSSGRSAKGGASGVSGTPGAVKTAVTRLREEAATRRRAATGTR